MTVRKVCSTNGTKNPRMVRKFHAANRPWYEKSTNGTKCLWYEKSSIHLWCWNQKSWQLRMYHKSSNRTRVSNISRVSNWSPVCHLTMMLLQTS